MVSRKKKKKSQSGSVSLFVILVVLVCVAYEPVTKALQERTGTESPVTVANQERTENTESTARLEIPAPLKGVPEQILTRRTYTVSYNREWNLPNWVAWELNTERLVERESRTNKFLPDPDLPPEEAVTTADYTNSGYDRGHMCPAADNRWHWWAMQESFYMTNICPQNHNLNAGDWKELEDACRRWAKEEGSIYIVCGPIVYKKGKARTIGREHSVRVPDAFFKVVLCTTSTPPRAIGFIYKNSPSNRPMYSYVNTVDEVERITGIDFFPALPDEVEAEVEGRCEPEKWEIN